MERSSSRKTLRSERLGQSPYSRPEKPTKRAGGLNSFPSLSSLVNFVSAPFRRSNSTLPQHSQDVTADIIEIDQKSESGSEDNWDGEPPVNMVGQDIFSLAAAGGREGNDFDKRAEVWRAREDKSKKSNELLRGLPATTSSWNLAAPPASTILPSPSMPALSGDLKQNLNNFSTPATSVHPQKQSYLSDFTPRAESVSTPYRPSPASSVALHAFLEAKRGQRLGPEDIRVIESLSSMHAESSSEQRLGGWSAGTYAASPRVNGTPFKLATSTHTSPVTPGPVFSLGTNPPLPPRSATPASQRKVTYLGPGMSPRRLLGKPKSGLKPLFNFDIEPKNNDDAAGKKRKVDVPEAHDVDSMSIEALSPAPPSPTPPTISSLSPSPSSVIVKSKSKISGSSFGTPVRPSPLSQTVKASPDQSPRNDIIKAGKRRAADIMREVIDAEIGPLDAPSHPPPMVINPYEETAFVPKLSPAHASSTQRKSSLKLSVRGTATPTRGAAEKIERLRTSTRKLTTLEMVSGFKPSVTAGRTEGEREKSPQKEMDEIEEDKIVEPSPSPAPLTLAQPKVVEPSPAPVIDIPEPEAFKAFPTPSFSFKTTTTESTTSTPREAAKPAPAPAPSFAIDSIVSASKPVPSPVFSPSPIAATPVPELETSSSTPAVSSGLSRRWDPSAIYLSAKDSALKVSKDALPFFTFTLPSPTSLGTVEISEAVKVAARARASSSPAESFTFTLQKLSPQSPQSFSFPQPSPVVVSEWTCDTCMLKNPDSAKDKCTICEAPRPSSKPVAAMPAPFGLKLNAPLPSGEWTCDTCMLKNPASATEKCTICEAAKPSAKATTAPAAPFSFSISVPATSSPSGEWTCGLCMLKNPATATEKCTICEAPKPAAASSAAVAAVAASSPFQITPKLSSSAPGGEWTCKLCMLKNPASATQKCTVCEEPKP